MQGHSKKKKGRAPKKSANKIRKNVPHYINKINSQFNILYIFILIIIYVILATTVNKLPFISGFLFFVFQVFGIFIPGAGLLLVLKLETENTIRFVGFSYGVGYCLNMVLYILVVPLGLKNYMPLFVAFIAAISSAYIILCIRRKKSNVIQMIGYLRTTSIDAKMVLCISAGLFTLQFLIFGLNNTLPTNGDRTYYLDTLYWVDNAITLTRGFPLANTRGLGAPFSYHYLTSMQLAQLSLATHIDVTTACLSYSYIQSNLLLSLGLYILFSSIFKKKKIIILAILLICYTDGYYGQTTVFYVQHLLAAPFGFDIATALASFCISFVITEHKHSLFNWKRLIIFLLLSAACMGSKAPVMCVFLGFLFIYCLNWIFIKKEVNKGLFWGVGCLAVCTCVYFAIMRNSGAWNAAGPGGNMLSWQGTISYVPILQKWDMNLLSEIGFPKGILAGIYIIVFLLLANMSLFFITIIGLIHMVATHKFKVIYIAPFFALIGGTCATLLLQQVGFSQVYFIYSAFLYMLIFGLKNLEDIPWNKRRIQEVATKGLTGMVIAFSLFFAIKFSHSYIKDGLKTITSYTASASSAFADTLKQNNVGSSDYEAYSWIKNNLEKDAVLVTNLTSTKQISLVVSAFTERQMWVESRSSPGVSNDEAYRRFEIIDRCFLHNDYLAINQMKEEGVDYIVYIKREPTYINDFQLPIIYENATITVYKTVQ
jgi:hypothetical protein